MVRPPDSPGWAAAAVSGLSGTHRPALRWPCRKEPAMGSAFNRVWGGLTCAAALVGSLLTPPGTAQAKAPAYLTLMFSQSAWTITENCVPVTTGVMTPDRIGRQFQRRGLVPPGTVVTGWVAEHDRTCTEDLPLYPV